MNYLYKSDRKSTLERLQGLERGEDGSTFDLIDSLGVSPGWKCLEIGAGAGSVVRWLDGRVKPAGRVVATDLEVDLLSDISSETITVIRHDFTVEELPRSAFDLVHARHVLIHVSGDMLGYVQKLAGALRPGGWLLLEESDLESMDADERSSVDSKNLYRHVISAIHNLYEGRGMDLRLGVKLAGLMQKIGLVDVDCSERRRTVCGADEEALFHRMTFFMLRERLVGKGGLSAVEFDAFLDLHNDPAFSYKTRTTVSSWGRVL